MNWILWAINARKRLHISMEEIVTSLETNCNHRCLDIEHNEHMASAERTHTSARYYDMQHFYTIAAYAQVIQVYSCITRLTIDLAQFSRINATTMVFLPLKAYTYSVSSAHRLGNKGNCPLNLPWRGPSCRSSIDCAGCHGLLGRLQT